MKIRNLSRRIATLAAVAGALVATSASAHLITSVVSAGPFVFAGTVPLLGMTTPGFALAAGERIVVTFSADCAVLAAAGDFTSFTDVDIVLLAPGPVVAQVMQPTFAQGARFCSANGTAALDGQARNSITVTGGGLAANVYQVQVRARTNGPAGTQAFYGDRSLVVSR